jgi:uncharacterized protein YceH (UPF0502 family)
MMHLPLTDSETRVLAALVEKAITTPEYYPLTLNALVSACNQKSNRDPVTAYDETDVALALEGLRNKALAHEVRDGRAARYRQYFAEAFDLSGAEEAMLAELMLRGPQTVGELRGRLERFGVTVDAETVEAALEALAARPAGALVCRLPRQPGRKEARYAHLLAGPVACATEEETPLPRPGADRLSALEEEVRTLRDELTRLREEVDALRKQWE